MPNSKDIKKLYNQTIELPNNTEKTGIIEEIRPIVVQTLAVNASTIPKIDEKRPVLDELKEEVALYDWDTEIMLKIAFCESSYNPRAVNSEIQAKEKGITKFSSCGLFQINSVECTKDYNILFDFKYNILRAYKLYLQNGYYPWYNCSKKLGLI